MAPSDPFDFSDFGAPSARQPQQPGAPAASRSAGRETNRPFDTGFDPFADQAFDQARPVAGDAFGVSDPGLGGGALVVARPPVALFALALGLAVAGVVIGVLWGPSLPAAFAGWLLAGPVAIGVLAEFTRVDTQRRANAVYSAPRWVTILYWAVLGVCLLGIAVGAWHIAIWAGGL
ncbi:hypothetical protein [Mycobacterium persicum]|uniref:Transmembrane protein n=1 Tax=Mycobacterium persicum TaxID=1487726 RepID=A0A8E2LQQ9_9MYCO|nr:hypothetical protein [Mycobacterium persicum]KZS80248.1 hypothetical protein A4G31_26655 [Mycobacterium persicum]ORB34535.1 hypothetical protein BST40_25440 [Mycobacterium persicum]ORB92402.1 hypothetical protein B1T49_27675 [Mycobacterium persicum]ORB97802.1 hypothetical protein B1T44_28515 [Mycobacterium persicum]ORC09874.1 hypothetical protein B4U45_28020 [Mycobacterium persicum]